MLCLVEADDPCCGIPICHPAEDGDRKRCTEGQIGACRSDENQSARQGLSTFKPCRGPQREGREAGQYVGPEDVPGHGEHDAWRKATQQAIQRQRG